MKHWAIVGALLAGLLPVMAVAQGLGGVWHEDCQCWRNMPWGSAEWVEPDVGRLLKQDLDFFPLSRSQQGSPLIIYAHAATATKSISVTRGFLYPVLVQQARANGFSVASIEYRHPVRDDFIVPAPHDDVADATRWIRAHASELGVDPHNFFYLGHSRGTLTLWTALHDRADPEVQVNAVYGYNAQTTYRGSEMADDFIVPSDRAAFVAGYQARHPQYALFGSALADATPDMPPVLLRYSGHFFHTLVPAALFNEHHPDFGLALCARLLPRNPRAPCTAVDDTPIDHAYDGFVEFFSQYLRH